VRTRSRSGTLSNSSLDSPEMRPYQTLWSPNNAPPPLPDDQIENNAIFNEPAPATPSLIICSRTIDAPNPSLATLVGPAENSSTTSPSSAAQAEYIDRGYLPIRGSIAPVYPGNERAPPLEPMIPVGSQLRDIYTRHRDILENSLPRCKRMGWSQSFKTYKQIELSLYIATQEGYFVDYGNNCVAVIDPVGGTPTLQQLVEGLGLCTGSYGTFKNGLTLYFRVWAFWRLCQRIREGRAIEIPVKIREMEERTSRWVNAATLDVSMVGPWYIGKLPVVILKRTLSDYIVSQWLMPLQNTR
jgi:hypothetical protein